jgi:hypothetical protein
LQRKKIEKKRLKIATKLRINGLGFFSKWTGLKFVKKKYRSDFGKISEKQWKDWNDKVKYESFEKNR